MRRSGSNMCRSDRFSAIASDLSHTLLGLGQKGSDPLSVVGIGRYRGQPTEPTDAFSIGIVGLNGVIVQCFHWWWRPGHGLERFPGRIRPELPLLREFELAHGLLVVSHPGPGPRPPMGPLSACHIVLSRTDRLH